LGDLQGTSIPQAVFNIVKNLVGEGMLSLPAGVAAGTGLGLAIVILTLFGLALGYTFSVMGRACNVTRTKTHKGCGEALSGPVFAQTMAVMCTLKTASTCLAYAIVLGDSYSRILHFFCWRDPFWTSRQVILLGITALILLPLVLQRDLSCLSYASCVGVAGEIFVVGVMSARYLDGSYASPHGLYWNSTRAVDHPEFSSGTDVWHTSVMTFVLFGSMSTAFIAHYNAPKFYSQMRKDRHPLQQPLRGRGRATTSRFNIAVGIGFCFAWVIYLWVMSVGYLTFGEASEGLILNNYSEEDPWATAARVSIGFAVMFGFPLAFISLRDNTFSVFGLDEANGGVFYAVTFALLALITAAACVLHDLGLVNSLGGAVFGACITLIFPGVLAYLASRQKDGAKEFSKLEGSANLLLIGFGVVLLLVGSTVNVVQKCYPQLLHRSSAGS